MRGLSARTRRVVWGLGFILSSAGLGLVIGSAHTDLGTQPVLTYPLITSQNCRGCHGYDFDPDHFIEPADTWMGTMMANSARDPLFWAALDVANNDSPGIGDFCLRCHAPGAWLAGRSEPPGGSTDGCGLEGLIDDAYASDFDGVTCHLCHRMMVNEAPPGGQLSSYQENAQFWIDDSDCDGMGQPCRRGPYAYAEGETTPPHPFRYSPYHLTSDFCGNCHNVTNPVRNLLVNGVDQGIRFPLERTHKEWAQSDYAVAGPTAATCQGCHMPEAQVQDSYACAFFTNDRTGNMAVHQFAGGNSWIPDVLRQEYLNLGLDVEFAAVRDTAIDMLQDRSADLAVTAPSVVTAGTPLAATVRVTNRTGHKLPTGYAEGRRMWIAVEARDGNGAKFWESGAYNPATGVLTHDPAIKIYRAEQGTWNRNGTNTCDVDNGAGRALFHFTRNDCVKLDNRIPPLGFTGGVNLETRPVGYVYPETSPGSGKLVNYDDTPYSIPVPPGTVSPVTVTATLRYQTASKDYVEFLRDEAVANNFPDDCIDRSSGLLSASRGEHMYDLWTTYGRSAPVDMEASSAVTAVTTPATPGEASRTDLMRVTSFDRMTGTLTISYEPACSSSDHTVYAGLSSGLASMTFTERVCNRGTSGTTSFTLGAGSYFFVIVGSDGAKEGSYGRNRAGLERPEDTGASACNLPRDLSATCSSRPLRRLFSAVME